jgi:Glycosyl hydrolase family 26
MATPQTARRLLLCFVLAALALTALPASSGAKAAAVAKASGHHAALADARGLAKPGPCSRFARRNLVARHGRGSARRLLRQRCQPKRAPKATASAATGPLYWGAWIGDQLTGTEAPWDLNAIERFEGLAGKDASVINFSSPFADCSRAPCNFYEFPEAEMESIRAHGSIPFFSWASQSTPATLDQPDFQLSDVIEGHHDAYIREFAEAAKAWGHPFFLRFNWEMNGGWFAWAEGVNGNQQGEFVAAWRHVHDIFAAVGATNATWVWCPNVDPTNSLQDLAPLYPGDEYVDWTGLDGYNWGTNPARPDKWRSFDDLFRSTYDEITQTIAPGKPLIVSEIGSTEHGGSKAEWIADALESAATEYPQLRGLLWFEKFDDGMDWPIETSSSSASAFAAGIQSSAYLGNSFGSAAPGAVQPAT